MATEQPRIVSAPTPDKSGTLNKSSDGPEPMTDEEVLSYCWGKATTALNDTDDEISETRQTIQSYYYGEPYGDERPGFSKQVTREVLEVVEWSLPPLMRAFTGGPRAVSFEPEGQDDYDLAAQETAVINNILLQKQTYYATLRTWFKDALMYPNGYIKVWWDESQDPIFTEYDEITMEQFLMLRMEAEQPNAPFDIVSVEMNEDNEDDESGGPSEQQQQPTVKCVVRENRSKYELCCEAVPPEEVLVSSNAKDLDLDKADFVCHYTEPTRSELIGQGYPVDVVYALPEAERLNTSTERESRQRATDETFSYAEYDDGAQVRVERYECYLRIDADGDGIAELRKVVFSGKEMLENKYTDYQPMIALSSVPISHRHIGMSSAEIAMPTQRVQSTLLRQMLDNLYRVNGPRSFAGRSVDKEQLLNYVPFGMVEMDNPNTDIVSESIPIAVDKILPVMQWMEEELGGRTGVSKHTQGLDADTLAKSTMGAFVEALGQASQRLEMIAREFGEMGIKKLALKTHHLMRKHQDQPLAMELTGQWTQVNPRDWKERTDMKCHVGTGAGSPREQVAALMGILEMQKEALQIGLTTKDRLYNTLDDLCILAGKPSGSRYFLDPKSEEGQQAAQQQQKQMQDQQTQEQQMMQQDKDRLFQQADLDRQVKQKKDQADFVAKALDREADYTEQELKYSVDIPGKGIEGGNVTPLKTGQ